MVGKASVYANSMVQVSAVDYSFDPTCLCMGEGGPGSNVCCDSDVLLAGIRIGFHRPWPEHESWQPIDLGLNMKAGSSCFNLVAFEQRVSFACPKPVNM